MRISFGSGERSAAGQSLEKCGRRSVNPYSVRPGEKRQKQNSRDSGYEGPAAAAATAIALSTVKNCWLWPMKSPLAVKALTAATAPANLSVSGRIIETWGRFPLNSKGTGKIRLG